MKKLSLLLFVMLSFGFAEGQDTYHFRTTNKPGFTIEKSDSQGISLNYTIAELGIYTIQNEKATGHEILLKGNFGSTAEGLPNLPVENRYLAVPSGARVSVEIKENAIQTLSDIDLLPAAAPQGNTEPTLPVLRKDPSVYDNDAFFPEQHAVLSPVSKIRGLDVVMLSISPIRYNPVKMTLEVVYDMDIEIRFEGGNGIFGEARYRNPDWDTILRNLVINSDMLPEAHYYDLVNQAVRDNEDGCEYLIIAPDDESILAWADTLKHFRTQQGILTKVVTVSECGGNNPDTLRNYVRNAYENWAIPPAVVLIFGDYLYGSPNNIDPYIYHLVSWQGYHYDYPTDNPIVDINGDCIPDIALTRMAASTLEQYQLQVEKTIHYELNPSVDPFYYDHPVITSGYQNNTWFMFTSQSVNGFFRNKLGKHPTNLYMVYNLENPSLLPPDSAWSIAQNTEAVLDYFGPSGENYIPQSIGDLDDWQDLQNVQPLIESLNQGSFLTLFRDHSSNTGWACPLFENRHFSRLTFKDPTFVLSIGCSCGDFSFHGNQNDVYSDCFNSKLNKQPVGSIGSIGAASGTYTQHNDLITWGFLDYLFPEFLSTMGSDTDPDFARPSYALTAAKLFLRQQTFIPYAEQPDFADRTMNVFNHLGEGYLSLYTEVPTPISHTAIPYHFGDLPQYNFTAEEGTLVCFSTENEILSVTKATGTPQYVTLPLMEEGTCFTMTLTKHNRLRTSLKITAIDSGQPYVYVSDYTLNDEDGNGQPDYGETIHIDLTLHNTGELPSTGGIVTLLDNSPYYEVLQGSASYSQIALDGHISMENALTFRLADDVPDQTDVKLVFQFTDGGHNHEHTEHIIANAPLISIDPEYRYSYSGLPSNHIKTDRETQITLSVKNTGHSTSQNIWADMTLKAPFVTVRPTQLQEGLAPGDQTDITLTAVPKENGATNTWLQSHLEIHHGAYISAIDTMVQYGSVFEGFESDVASIQISNNSTVPWTYDDTDAFEGERCFVARNMTNTTSLSLATSWKLDFPSSVSFYCKNKAEDTLYLSYRNPETNVNTTLPLVGDDLWHYYVIPIQKDKTALLTLRIRDPYGTGNYAKIDNLCFPPQLVPVVFAGDTLITCGNTPVEITTAYAYNCSSVFWTTNGDGTFESLDTVATVYIPGNQDLINNKVDLTLHAATSNDTLAHTTSLYFGEIPFEHIEGLSTVNISINPVSHYSVGAVNDASYQWALTPSQAGEIFAEDNEAEIAWNTAEEVSQVLLSVTIENDCDTKTIQKNVVLSGFSIPEWDDLMPAEAVLYNILGEHICTFHSPHSNIDDIRIPQDIKLPSGIYILKLNTPQASKSKKIIIP